ncbi:MAG: hypothetical protein GXO39_04295, partial [Thermotogae bacterium]|nr:hypothetical protein [Thermotogota bacterium]
MIWVYISSLGSQAQDPSAAEEKLNFRVATHFIPSEVREGKVLYTTFPYGVSLLKDGLFVRGIKITFGKVRKVEPLHPAKAKFNYFKGKDPKKWRTNVPSYKAIAYREVYPGIDLILTGKEGGQLEFQWVIKPGSDPKRIALKVEGGKFEAEGGDVYVVKDGKRVLRISSLSAYQGAEKVKVRHVVEGNVLKYALGSYDPSHTLVIDPDLSTLGASTFLGGSSEDVISDIEVGEDGSVYVVGYTYSSDFPTTPGAYDETYNGGGDVFVAKLSSDLSTLILATFLGGSESEIPDPYGYQESPVLTIGPWGNVYVAGVTRSPDFPITPGAYDDTLYLFSDSADVFIAKLEPDLANLLASTYLGGHLDDVPFAIAVDEDGSVYVAGLASYDDFPTTPGAYDRTNVGVDGFISKLDSSLSRLLASTFLGGSFHDAVKGLELDQNGAVYVVGYTHSNDFPATPGAYDETFNGWGDVFAAKLSADLTTLEVATYLGGSEREEANHLIIGPGETVYVVGYTLSNDFPMTPNAYDRTYNDSGDVFVSVFDSSLSTLEVSTYIGGDRWDVGTYIVMDPYGNVYVAGYTNSSNFPTTPGVYDDTHNGLSDAFVLALTRDLRILQASTYLGGSDYDYASAMTFDEGGNLYVAGNTRSNDFPIIPGAYDGTLGGYKDAFVSKFTGVFINVAEKPEKSNGYFLKDGSIHIFLRTSAYVGASIYSADGRLVKHQELRVKGRKEGCDKGLFYPNIVIGAEVGNG